MSLTKKFALAAISLVAFSLLVNGVFLTLSERRHLRALQRQEQEASIEKLARACSEAILSQNDLMMINYIRTLAERPEVAYAALVDYEGKTQAHNDGKKIGLIQNLDAWKRARLSSAPVRMIYDDAELRRPVLLLSRPIIVGNRRLGTALLGYDAAALSRTVDDALRSDIGRSLPIALATAAIAVLLSLILASGITRPLKTLRGSAVKIGEGHLGEKISLESRDEIGELARAFNEMASRLAELDQLKDEFISSVSHDLRAPLAAIYSYGEVLLSGNYGALSEGQSRAVGYILSSARSLNLMVNNVLDSAKMKAGHVRIEKKPVDLRNMIMQQLQLYQSLANRKSASISLDCDATCRVLGDAESIERVLSNLISNAVKFCRPEGKVSVVVSTEGEWATIMVENTGYGIAPEDLPRLFRRFERLEEQVEKTKDIEGSGLGLSVAKQLVELHGGKIWAESERDRATRFYFTLPAAAATARA